MSTAMWVALSCLIIISEVLAFNVDTVNVVRYRGERGSMFGFSVAQHKERGGSWVLIGAPEAQTRQPGVARGGAVFKCSIGDEDSCRSIPFDTTGNNNNSIGRQIDQKSDQWFGATVRSSGETGVVMACAPRYVWFSTTKNYRRDPVGTCYVAQNQFSDFSEYSPCRTRNWGYHRQGSCQAGLGADVSKNGKRLYVGAPGSWYWQGQLYDITSTYKMPFVSPDYTKIQELNMIEYESGKRYSGANSAFNRQNGEGQLFAQNPEKRPEVLATSEGPAQDDDSYLGYSVAAGNFDGTGEGGVAVGMPRGARLLGKVVLYSVNLTNLQNISGEQLGSYFSYSIAVGDIDGDGLDDLIVGAPFYTDLSNNENKYETGRVYIYYQKPDIDEDGYSIRFNRFHSRDGKNSKCRFGLSVASLGDINKDGFGDFAVGAPYDGDSERGAVYIYQGSKTGVRETFSQVIRGEELGIPTSTFGFSISGGIDMDDNQYPDLIVGAYDSDTAFFFRARPVVKIDGLVEYNSLTKHISLDDETCSLRDRTRVPCVGLRACLKYAGSAVEPYLDIDIGITLDSKKIKSPRMFFINEEGRNVLNETVRLTRNQQECRNYDVYIKPGIKDKLAAFEAELRYSLRDSSRSTVRVTRSLYPVLDANVNNIHRDSLFIQNNCGSDNICIPDLRLTTKKNVDKVLLGSSDRFSLDVRINNRGEDAFEANYNLQLPNGMNYINIERLDRDTNIPVYCSNPTSQNNMTVKCEIGNPLPQGKMVHFKVLLQPFYREGMKSVYEFTSFVNSTNPEDLSSVSDNAMSLEVPIWVETDLIVTGNSNPSEVHYQIKNYSSENIQHESEIGPQLYHLYSIRNKGPANIIEAETFILWPSYTLSGDHLVYLLEQPETNGNVKCDFVPNVNIDGIQVEKKRSFFDGHRGEGSSSSRTQGRGRVKVSEEERRKIAQEDLESGNGYRRRIGTSGSSLSSSSSSSTSSASSGTSSSWSEERSRASASSSSSTSSNTASASGRQTIGRQHSKEDSQSSAIAGSSVSGGAITVSGRRQEESAANRGAVGTEKVTYEDGSYRQRIGAAGSAGADSRFAWREESERTGEEKRRLESERRQQTDQGNYRTRTGESNQSRSNEEAWKLYGSNEFRTVAFDIGQGGSSAGGAVSAPNGRTDDSLGRNDLNVAGGSKVTSTGYRTAQEEAERRRYEEEIARRAGTRITAEDEVERRRYEEELERRAESAEREYEEEVNKRRTYEEEKRRYEEDMRRRQEEERRRYEEERRRYEAEQARQASSRRTQYEENISMGSASEEERRRIEGGRGGSHTYSTQYETNSSWDSATGGGRRVDSKWSINDNGVIQSGASSGTSDAEYERRLLEERQRRIQNERDRDHGSGAQTHFYNSSSYSSERRVSSNNRNNVDPDLGYRRDIQGDAPSRSDSKLKSKYGGSSQNLVFTDKVEKAHSRYRREQPLIPRFVRSLTDDLASEKELSCGATNCTRIRCIVGPLQRGQEAFITVRGRIWIRTLQKIGYHKEVMLSSLGVSRVTRLPHIGRTENANIAKHEVLTEVMPQDLPIRPEVVPLWIVVLSACAGAIILLLLVAALYACGFFKRNRPTESAEKQPLNQNGYHNGDEAL